MHMHQLLDWYRRFDQLVATGRHLPESRADAKEQIGRLDVGRERRVNANADVARIIRVRIVEQILKAPCACDREVLQLDKALQVSAGTLLPTASAHDHEGPLRLAEQRYELLDCF